MPKPTDKQLPPELEKAITRCQASELQTKPDKEWCDAYEDLRKIIAQALNSQREQLINEIEREVCDSCRTKVEKMI